MSRLLRVLPLIALFAPLAFLLFASRDADAERPGPRVLSPPGFPVRIALSDGSELLLSEPPRRIVAANAGAVDFVTLLVGPERVAALPRAAAAFSRLHGEQEGWSDLPRFEGYVAETLLAFDADLVVAHGWQNPETTALLGEAGIPVLTCPLPASWQEIVDTLHVIAAAVGASERGRELAADLDRRRAALAAEPLPDWTAVSYSNLGAGGWVAGEGTTADILLELVGLENAAARHSGYQQIDLEGLLVLDPDVIVVGASDDAEGITSTERILREQTLLTGLPALVHDRIVTLPQQYFSAASTELLAAAEILAAALR